MTDSAPAPPPPPDDTDSSTPEVDYWASEWYADIKSIVATVAATMRTHGVDPTLISPDDAWAHYRSIVMGHWEQAKANLTGAPSFLPAELEKFLSGNDEGRLVFMGLWRSMDVEKLLRKAGIDPKRMKP